MQLSSGVRRGHVEGRRRATVVTECDGLGLAEIRTEFLEAEAEARKALVACGDGLRLRRGRWLNQPGATAARAIRRCSGDRCRVPSVHDRRGQIGVLPG